MATADATEHYIDIIKQRIMEAFDVILSEVVARRDELLAQVDKMRRAWESQKSSLIQSQRELEEMKTQLENIPLKQNLAMKKQQDSLADIKSELKQLDIKLSSCSLKFDCSINQITRQVKEFGEVTDTSNSLAKYHSKYSKKLTANQIISRNLPYGYTRKLHVDTENDLLYVFSTDATNALIFVYNARDFTFIDSFGITKFYEKCLTTSKDIIYLGRLKNYNRSELLAIDRRDYSTIRGIDYQGNALSNIFVESENQILVLCVLEGKVKFHIYDRTLNFRRELEIIYEWPETMDKVRSRFRQEQLFILIEDKLLVFNNLGVNTRSIFIESMYYVSNGDTIRIFTCCIFLVVEDPKCYWVKIMSFWIDEVGNIIVAVSTSQSVRFFSPEGNLFHKIGEDMVGSDQVGRCTDVTMYNDTLIVAGYDDLRIY